MPDHPQGVLAPAKCREVHYELLYRLRHADDLKSYDTAPKTADLLVQGLLPES